MNNNLSLQLFNRLTAYIHNNTKWEFKIIDSHIYVRNTQLRGLKEIKRFYTYPIEINNNVNLENELNYFLIGGILCTIKNDEIQHHHMYSLIETLHNYNNIYYKDLPCQDLIDLLVPIFNNYNRNNFTLEELAIHLDLMGI
jgi:hypothetical protein